MCKKQSWVLANFFSYVFREADVRKKFATHSLLDDFFIYFLIKIKYTKIENEKNLCEGKIIDEEKG